jgi:hypothetical protein
MIDLGLVFAEADGEIVYLVHQQRNASLLYPAGRDAQRFAELVLLPIGFPVSS